MQLGSAFETLRLTFGARVAAVLAVGLVECEEQPQECPVISISCVYQNMDCMLR